MPGLIIDNFAGGGGASTGIEMAIGRPVDIAINHDPEAIEMHTANHPRTLHLTEDVFEVNPRKLCAGRDVDLAWFSPDCTHFSKAKGAAIERDRKIRGLAWVAVKWADQVQPAVICLENVEEFMTWGPLTKSGKPNKAKQGECFRKFVAALENHGYIVEWRVLTACDYGSPTSRKRFFLIARCDGEEIVWPEATHGPGRIPYRTAADCIDWSIPTVSIFATQDECRAQGLKCIRPLAENTLKRIARGVMKFIVNAEDPYILNDEQMAAFMSYHYTGHDGYDVRNPLKTVTAWDHHALVSASISRQFGNSIGHKANDPLGTITAGGQGKSQLVSAFLSKYHCERGDRCASANEPVRTIDTSNRFGVITANLITIDRTKSGDEHRAHPVDRPFRTITQRNNHALVASHLTKLKGTNLGSDLREPVQTILAGRLHHAEVRAFLVKYYGQGIGQDCGKPLDTITSRDRFGLVTVKGEFYRIEDIGLRMLQPHELAMAQGFPKDYILTGTKTSQVARIGNSVPPHQVAAIIRANVTNYDAEVHAAA